MSSPDDDRTPTRTATARESDQDPGHATSVPHPATPAGPDGSPRASGSRIGRYVLREPLGRGGMGLVYRAHDPDLHREVAIKVVHARPGRRGSEERLLAEARAMARLRHPCVVPIFDVGTLDGGIYLVMPLVGGGTLRDWLGASVRPWREVVDRFLSAGRGLAAAHAVGLVHRDFKPHNVLLEEDGTVMVGDFGLVVADPGEPGAGVMAAGVTSVAGTPAYMAPEQAAGDVVDARADQYSFCVALWEGLTGRRPTDDETRPRTGPPAPSLRLGVGAKDLDTTRWLFEVLTRGLSFQPARRWPSMDALLGELTSRIAARRAEGTGSPSRRWLWLPGTAAVAATAAVAFALLAEDGRSVGVLGSEPTPVTVSGPRTLTALGRCATDPVFSDDRTVVFGVPGREGLALHAIGVDGTLLRQISAPSESVSRALPGTRPGEIGFLLGGANDRDAPTLAIVDLYTGARRQHPAAELTRLLDPDGAMRIEGPSPTDATARLGWLAFHAGTQRMAAIPVGGGPVCHRLLPDGEQRCTGRSVPMQLPSFGADGATVYTGDADGVWALDVVTGEQRRVVEVDAAGGVAVSPDGRHLVHAGCVERASITDLSTAPETLLAEDDRVTAVAVRRGGELAWVRQGRDGRELVVRDAVEQRVIAYAGGDVVAFAPSVHGSSLRAAITLQGPVPGLTIESLDSDTSLRISDRPGDRNPMWLDEHTLAFERVGLDGARRVHLVRLGNPIRVDEGRPMRALASNPATHELLVLDGSDALSWWDPATDRRRPQRLAGPGVRFASVSPSGRWLVVQTGAAGETVWRAALPDGAFEQVYRETRGRTLGQVVVRDDGHLLAAPSERRGELIIRDVAGGW